VTCNRGKVNTTVDAGGGVLSVITSTINGTYFLDLNESYVTWTTSIFFMHYYARCAAKLNPDAIFLSITILLHILKKGAEELLPYKISKPLINWHQCHSHL
jgi:hypothetical protein